MSRFWAPGLRTRIVTSGARERSPENVGGARYYLGTRTRLVVWRRRAKACSTDGPGRNRTCDLGIKRWLLTPDRPKQVEGFPCKRGRFGLFFTNRPRWRFGRAGGRAVATPGDVV